MRAYWDVGRYCLQGNALAVITSRLSLTDLYLGESGSNSSVPNERDL